MSGELTPREEERIMELLAQRVPDPDLRAEIERDPRLRARLQELEAVQRRLVAAAAADRQREIEEAVAAGPAPGEDEALEALRRAMSGSPRRAAVEHGDAGPRRRPAGRWVPWLLVAVAAVLVVVFGRGWFQDEGGGPGEGQMLNNGEGVEGYAPQGEVEAFDEFVWPEAARADSVQQVWLWAGESAVGLPTRRSTDLSETTRWRPSDEDLRKLGDRLVWRVVEIGSLGSVNWESPLLSARLSR